MIMENLEEIQAGDDEVNYVRESESLWSLNADLDNWEKVEGLSEEMEQDQSLGNSVSVHRQKEDAVYELPGFLQVSLQKQSVMMAELSLDVEDFLEGKEDDRTRSIEEKESQLLTFERLGHKQQFTLVLTDLVTMLTQDGNVEKLRALMERFKSQDEDDQFLFGMPREKIIDEYLVPVISQNKLLSEELLM